MNSQHILALVVSLVVLVSIIPVRPALGASQYEYVVLTIKGVGLVDPIENPWLLEDGADWTVKVLFYNGEVWDEATIGNNLHNNDFPVFNVPVTWRVDLSRFQNVTFEIQLWERDGWGLLPSDIADVSAYTGGGYDDYNGTFPRGAMYVGYYNLVNNSLTGDYVENLGNLPMYGNYYRTSGNFDGSVSVDENDADLWLYIKDDYGGDITRRVPEEYSTIQAAIDAVIPGGNETVIVRPGTYNERITISKSSFMVLGLPGAIIDGSGGGGGPGNTYNVVFISGNYVTFSGFQVQGGTGSGVHGIGVFGNYSSISRNTVTGNTIGVYTNKAHAFFIDNVITNSLASGVCALQCYNNTITGNQITNNQEYGIFIYGSCLVQGGVPNLVKGNTISNNSLSGLEVEFSDNNYIQGNFIHENDQGLKLIYSGGNTLRNNAIERNNYNFGVQAYDDLQDYLQDVDNTNLVDGKPIYYWVNKTSGQIPSDAGYVAVVNSNNVSIRDLELKKNYNGMLLAFSTSTMVHNVSSVENWDGMTMYFSNNTIVHHNNFVNWTSHQALLTSSFNTIWDDGYPSGGNYWSRLAGIDLCNGFGQNITGADGIYDSSYTIAANNVDRYPRVVKWPSHDVTVLDVVPDRTIAKSGNPVSFNVSYINQGDFPETFNISIRANETDTATKTIANLTPRSPTTLSLTWDTTGHPIGNYVISAYASPVQNETDIEDNTYTDGKLTVVDRTWEASLIGSDGYPVVDFAVHNGSLYAAADNRLYAYNGSSWKAMNAPTFVTSLEPYGDKLIVGGQGTIYCYDETSFDPIFSVPTYIKVLGVYDNRLYAGTMLASPPTLYYCNGSVTDPSDWHIDTDFSAILGFSGAFGSIDSFAVYDSVMYVGSGGGLYSFNGASWSIAASYDDVYAFLDMQVYNGKLYLATRDQGWRKPMYRGGSGFSGRVIEFDGASWTTVLDHDYWIYSLGVYDDKLYAGTANKILTYNGTSWETSFNATEGAYYAISMITYDGKIYVGMGNGYIFADPAPLKAEHETIVVPEFSSFLVLPLFMLVTLLAVIVYRRKQRKNSCINTR